MQLLDEVRSNCRSIAERARFVSIDLEAWQEPPRVDAAESSRSGPDQVLQLDSINFGSGWFPTLRKRSRMSGYRTVAASALGSLAGVRPARVRPGGWGAGVCSPAPVRRMLPRRSATSRAGTRS